jgi:hypothetical protein
MRSRRVIDWTTRQKMPGSTPPSAIELTVPDVALRIIGTTGLRGLIQCADLAR